MNNPFELLLNRLDQLEALSREVLHQLSSTSPEAPAIGGIDLAQQITRLSKARIYALVSARAIPHAKRGNKLYFNRGELLAWVTQGTRADVSVESDNGTGRSSKRAA